MTWGFNGAGPTGVSPTTTMVGQGGATYPPLFNASFESVMAAVSRGEVSLNMLIAAGNQYGGVGNANGNPTLLQALSQGVPQNGTNGLGTGTGPVGNGTISSCTGNTTFGGTQTVDAKAMVNVPAISNPIQYGGN